MPSRKQPTQDSSRSRSSPIQDEKRKKRGGARQGAGRPEMDPILKKVQIGIKLPRWILNWLANESAVTSTPRAQIVERAIIRQHKLKPPKLD